MGSELNKVNGLGLPSRLPARAMRAKLDKVSWISRLKDNGFERVIFIDPQGAPAHRRLLRRAIMLLRRRRIASTDNCSCVEKSRA